MILLHIHTKDIEISKEITNFLISEKLILNSFIIKEAYFPNDINSFLITCKTKALLFETIEKQLLEKFKNQYQDIYALPIVNMNWEQAQEIKQSLKK